MLGTIPTALTPEMAREVVPHRAWPKEIVYLHQNLGRRMRELEASRIMSSRNRLDENQYQLI